MNYAPKKLNEYIGQEKIKKSITMSLLASKKRKESFPHVLLHGGSGLGKTALAYVIANEFKAKCTTLLSPTIDSHEPIYTALEKAKRNEFIFLDEVHALKPQCQETLYNVMTNGEMIVKEGDYSYIKKIKNITIISATTELGQVLTPFRERFGFIIPLEDYSHNEMKQIVDNNVKKFKFKITDYALDKLATCSRLNPRTANRLLDRCFDTATVQNKKTFDDDVVDVTMDYLEIDSLGLNSYDKKILIALGDKFKGEPVGLKGLGTYLSLDEKAIETVYEPWLMKLGFTERTSRGRKITTKGAMYLAKNY